MKIGLLSSPIFRSLHSSSEGGVDIFEEDEAPFRHQSQQVIQLVIRQAPL